MVVHSMQRMTFCCPNFKHPETLTFQVLHLLVEGVRKAAAALHTKVTPRNPGPEPKPYSPFHRCKNLSPPGRRACGRRRPRAARSGYAQKPSS